jgi:hypothetical protein
MRPQNVDPSAAPVQQSWFQKNWMWVVGLGCGIPSLCCAGGLVISVIAGYAVQDLDPAALDKALNQGLQQQGTDTTDVAETDDKVRVDCGTPGPGGVDCDVKRTGGSSKVEACWDLAITCANGGVMRGAACATLEGNEKKAKTNMPVDTFDNQEGCDAPKSGEVQDLVVNLVN